jgi:hypothetical protein
MFHIYWEEVGGKNTVGYCSALPEGEALRWIIEELYPIDTSAEMLFAECDGRKYAVNSNPIRGYYWEAIGK